MRRILCTVIAICFASFATAQTADDDRIKELALQAILENPDIIMQAVAILEARPQEAQAAAAAEVFGSLADDSNAPVMGNPDGDVVIVEFFDYNCPYCRRSGEVLEQLLDQDKNIKIVMREWPILGPDSVIAARASLAARNQDQYEAFHWALMTSEGRASEASILRMAREVGLNVEKLQADMNMPVVDEHIQASMDMARALGFTGTPAFVIGEQTAPGFLSLEEMQGLVSAARGG